jgi:hypothetical protein
MSEAGAQGEMGQGPRIEAAQVVVRFVPDFSQLDQEIERRVKKAVDDMAGKSGRMPDSPKPVGGPVKAPEPTAPPPIQPPAPPQPTMVVQQNGSNDSMARALGEQERAMMAVVAAVSDIRAMMRDLISSVDALAAAMESD